jgi:3-deoxy-D-manno-octulosonate 8-phosphate phosphatase (KDO 8-P phosphatase)
MSVTDISPRLLEKITPIRLVVFDVDGTLTDGSLYLTGEGEIKRFNVHDGAGMKFLMGAGLTVAMLTKRSSAAVDQRAAELGITHVIQGAGSKGQALASLQKELGIGPEATAAMGDDLPDLEVFKLSGLKLAVGEAVSSVIAEADWVATRSAGAGAVREACELILKGQGFWEKTLASFR